MRVNELEFFDGRGLVQAKNGIVNSYDGSLLYNLKPASIVIPLTASNNSPSVVWDSNNEGLVVFTHSMNCYPIVSLYKSNGEQVYPTIKILSGTSFSLDFESSSRPIPEGETWQCVVTYGADYGNSGSIHTEIESVMRYLESITGIEWGGGSSSSSSQEGSSSSSSSQESSSSSSSQEGSSSSSSPQSELEEATNAQIDARSPSTAVITPANLVYAVRSVIPQLTEIPKTTTNYTLYDASSTLNNHCQNYLHVPYQTPTYVLPDILSLNSYTPTQDITGNFNSVHEIVVEVSYKGYARYENGDTDGKYCWRWSDAYMVYTDTESVTEGTTVVYDSYNGSWRSVGTVELYDSSSEAISLVASCNFEDASGNEIVPLNVPTIGVDSVVSYLCRWSFSTCGWHVLPVQLK